AGARREFLQSIGIRPIALERLDESSQHPAGCLGFKVAPDRNDHRRRIGARTRFVQAMFSRTSRVQTVGVELVVSHGSPSSFFHLDKKLTPVTRVLARAKNEASIESRLIWAVGIEPTRAFAQRISSGKSRLATPTLR